MLPLDLGACPKGPSCPYVHNPNKVAICKDYLQTGACSAGESCDLSHEATPERVPACLHFLRGNCSNDQCRYAHVRVNPTAPVCRPFASLGFCEKGASCGDRHVFECPDYARSGTCNNKKCRLPHVDRAGQLRKMEANDSNHSSLSGKTTANGAAEDHDTDLTSEEDEADSDDIDSDGLAEDLSGSSVELHSTDISGQQDFVQL